MQVDVAVIGAGPVGLLLANLVAARGHSVTVLEKQPQPYHLPRAIHFDGETMRAFQAAGLAQQVLQHTHVGRGMRFIGAQGEVLVDWPRAQEAGPMGWFESYRFYQPGLEFELRAGLERFAGASLHLGQAVTALDQDDDGVRLSLADGSPLHATFAIGCDGAQSFTREALGIGLHDLGFEERWLVCDLLLYGDQGDHGDLSLQFCDAEAPATYVRGAGPRRRWEMRVAADFPDDPDDHAIWARLDRWITPQDALLERAAVYTFRSRIAQSWRQGRIFLAGDAAHQTPPFMGQGMCAGIRDATNLAWKLSAVLAGADPALLKSYQSEREPNARAFIELAVKLGGLINQSAAGKAPRGRMRSIWPDLGPGLGARDGVGGALAPQVRDGGGVLADDAMGHGFYILAAQPIHDSPLPVVTGAGHWLHKRGVEGIVMRPDGYALGGFSTADARQRLEAEAAARTPRPASV